MIKMYVGLHVSARYSCQNITKREYSRDTFEKYSNVKLHENPPNGNRVVPADGQTDRYD
jgi:hypothetical protein